MGRKYEQYENKKCVSLQDMETWTQYGYNMRNEVNTIL